MIEVLDLCRSSYVLRRIAHTFLSLFLESLFIVLWGGTLWWTLRWFVVYNILAVTIS